MLHPNDASLHIRLAENFANTGHEIAAIDAARKAYHILKNENLEEAHKLTLRFGGEVAPEHEFSLNIGDYSILKEDFGLIATHLRTVHIKSGCTLFRLNDPVDYIYLILEGALVVNTESDGKQIFLNYLHAGALVGEGGLHPHQQRCATVMAHHDSLLLRFTAEELHEVFSKHPILKAQFDKEVLLRRHTTLLSSSPLFAQLPIDLRYLIAKRTWITCHEDQTTIKRAHTYLPHIGFIASGTVHIFERRNNSRHYCARLTTGDFIGLDKLMLEPPSELDFVAEGPCNILYTNYQVIEDVMAIAPEFPQQLKGPSLHSSD